MNPALATVLAAFIAAAGLIGGAALSAWFNRNKDRADIAQKVSEAWDPVFERMEKDLTRVSARCEKCETELEAAKAETREARAEIRRSNAVLRKLVHAIDTEDQAARDEAIAAARELV